MAPDSLTPRPPAEPGEAPNGGGPDQPPVAGREAATPRAAPPMSMPDRLAELAIVLLGVGFWGLLVFGGVAIFSASARSYWLGHWQWVPAGFLMLLLMHFLGRSVAEWRRKASRETATRALAQTVIPATTVAVMALAIYGDRSYWALAAQLIVIVVAALLPAGIYFLFLAARRPSILNEFVANLGRLGLLERRDALTESDEERRVRIESYLQRFEALYGELRFDPPLSLRDYVDALVRTVDGAPGAAGRSPRPLVGLGDLLNTSLIIPLGLVTVLTTLGWMLVLQPGLGTLPADGAVMLGLMPRPEPVNFAFLGAYFFGIQMLFRRFVRRDLGPNAYIAFANRILLSIIGAWLIVVAYAAFASLSPEALLSMPGSAPAAAAVASAASPASGPASTVAAAAAAVASAASAASASPAVLAASAAANALSTLAGPPLAVVLVLAFTLGVFPRVLWQVLSAAAIKIFFVKLALPSVEARQPLKELDGLTIWHETRLEEEDVENVPNMASVDLVELMLHTQIPIERLVSWVDQAILLAATGPGEQGRSELCDRLHTLGIRTATQLVAIASSPDAAARGALEKLLPDGQLAALVVALGKEVNFGLVRAWRDMAEVSSLPADRPAAASATPTSTPTPTPTV
ncbi:MAG: hypothetical protein L6Q75_18325 [Burkholderiaceae bacterium]|nr:hypothetical protein [Burkholderiaceae bacterium]